MANHMKQSALATSLALAIALGSAAAFISTPGFTELFELDPAEKQALLASEEALLRFAFRFLKQALYGEMSIPVRADAADKRRERYRKRVEQMERDAVERKSMDREADREALVVSLIFAAS